MDLAPKHSKSMIYLYIFNRYKYLILITLLRRTILDLPEIEAVVQKDAPDGYTVD